MSLQAIKAAQITVSYCGLYTLTLLNQTVHKFLLRRQARQEAKDFDRYTSLGMFPHDRLSANFVEWMPVFLGPLWSLAATGNLSEESVKMAWTYVGLRALYFGLTLKFGVNRGGLNIPLWISTFPGYGCLLYLLVAAIQGVF